MPDDLVRRLRRLVVWSDGDIGNEAADMIEDYQAETKRLFDMITRQRQEIETLQAERAGAQRQLSDMTYSRDTWREMTGLYQTMLKRVQAVRGE